MADLNIFIYQRRDSTLHRTHPTLKIIMIILSSYKITTGSNIDLMYYFGLILLSIYSSKMGFNILIKDLKYLLILGIIIFIFNRSITESTTYIVRIFEVLMLSSIFTGTTKPDSIAPALYKIVRNREISQNIALTLTLIPTFLISWRVIEEALKSRGLYISKNPFKIIKGLVPPLLIEIFKRSDEISTAMDSRCYNGWIEGDIDDNFINIKAIILVLLPYLLLIGKLLPQG